jgi:Xaa-Pro aminopeptidase
MTQRFAVFVVSAWAVVATASAAAQPLFTDAFPPEEFAARRARVMERIGEGVAILAGATEYPAYVKFRQNNHVFYLTGVEVPRVIVLIDGREKRTTLFVAARNERQERSEGPTLVPGEEAQRLTGIEAVVARAGFGPALARVARERPALYLPFRPESLGAGTTTLAAMHASASLEDAWDGRPSKEAAFLARVKAQAPQAEVRNLDPILDELRLIKSPREVALMREATRISGLGLMEGMRVATPGGFEYEIEAAADYVFKRHNAQGIAYFALVAAGKNAHYPHYHASQSRLDARDLVLFDYGPDYKYYTADVTRMFPASGTFDAWQREIYGIYLELYRALMSVIKPGVPVKTLIAEAVTKMDAAMAAYAFTEPKIKEAAARFVDGYRTRAGSSLGHFVGLEVHDVGVGHDVLRPGVVFTIEPALTIPDDQVYVRLEDVILVTDRGYENLSAFVPLEMAEIEKVMAEPGLNAPRSVATTR